MRRATVVVVIAFELLTTLTSCGECFHAYYKANLTYSGTLLCEDASMSRGDATVQLLEEHDVDGFGRALDDQLSDTMAITFGRPFTIHGRVSVPQKEGRLREPYLFVLHRCPTQSDAVILRRPGGKGAGGSGGGGGAHHDILVEHRSVARPRVAFLLLPRVDVDQHEVRHDFGHVNVQRLPTRFHARAGKDGDA